jgi:hypothetical protein
MPIEPKRPYQLTITIRLWDSEIGASMGFDETVSVVRGDFAKLMDMLKVFHETAQRFTGKHIEDM